MSWILSFFSFFFVQTLLTLWLSLLFKLPKAVDRRLLLRVLWLYLDGLNKQLLLLCPFVWNTVPFIMFIFWNIFIEPICAFNVRFVFFKIVIQTHFFSAVMLAHFYSVRSSAVNMYIIISYVSDLHHMSGVSVFQTPRCHCAGSTCTFLFKRYFRIKMLNKFSFILGAFYHNFPYFISSLNPFPGTPVSIPWNWNTEMEFSHCRFYPNPYISYFSWQITIKLSMTNIAFFKTKQHLSMQLHNWLVYNHVITTSVDLSPWQLLTTLWHSWKLWE